MKTGAFLQSNLSCWAQCISKKWHISSQNMGEIRLDRIFSLKMFINPMDSRISICSGLQEGRERQQRAGAYQGIKERKSLVKTGERVWQKWTLRKVGGWGVRDAKGGCKQLKLKQSLKWPKWIMTRAALAGTAWESPGTRGTSPSPEIETKFLSVFPSAVTSEDKPWGGQESGVTHS